MQTDTSPGENAAPITPNDTTGVRSRALYIGGVGDVVVTMTGGQTVTFEDVAAGTLLPISVRHVMAATTATLIVAIY